MKCVIVMSRRAHSYCSTTASCLHLSMVSVSFFTYTCMGMYAFTCVDNHPNSSGDEYMLPNVHGLLHLADAVQDLGPLWVHSCFPFESLNGNILKLYHGSQGVEKQVRYTYCTSWYSCISGWGIASMKCAYISFCRFQVLCWLYKSYQVLQNHHSLLTAQRSIFTTRWLPIAGSNTGMCMYNEDVSHQSWGLHVQYLGLNDQRVKSMQISLNSSL